MKIYVDVVLFLNFSFDFLLLLSVSLILRRNVKIFNIMLGSFIGSLSVLLLFFTINSFQLFLLKILISVLMILVTFKYKNIKYFFQNFLFLYMSSIVLGGFLYFLNLQFSYKNEGLIFFHNGLSINFIFLILFSPIFIFIYVNQLKKLKNNYSNYYEITLTHHKKEYKLTAYLDTGNILKDPYFKKPVIFINNEKLYRLFKKEKYFIVPYHTIDNSETIKCYKIDKLYIKNIGYKNQVLVAFTNKKININGVECVLNRLLMEG